MHLFHALYTLHLMEAYWTIKDTVEWNPQLFHCLSHTSTMK